MKPGREFDALVAEKVMGCKGLGFKSLTQIDPNTLDYQSCDCPGHPHAIEWNDMGGRRYALKHYSTDISAAWEVVEKLSRNGCYGFDLGWTSSTNGKPWHATFAGGRDAHAWAETAPHAICLAALKAVGA